MGVRSTALFQLTRGAGSNATTEAKKTLKTHQRKRRNVSKSVHPNNDRQENKQHKIPQAKLEFME